jgi:hypothetical protein
MGSSWSGFQPQNELVKLQWAALEASEFRITAQEFEILLSITGLKKKRDTESVWDSEKTDPGSEP